MKNLMYVDAVIRRNGKLKSSQQDIFKEGIISAC